MDNVIDNLQIEIESSSTSASDNIKKLTAAIRKLDKIGQGTGLTSLTKNLKKFADLDFSRVSRQLTKISNSLKTISKLRDVAQGMTLADPSVELGRTVKKKPKQTESVLDDEDMGIDVPPEANRATETLRSTSEAARETSEEFRAMNSEAASTLGELSTKLQAVQRLFELTSIKAQHLGEDWQKTMEKFGANDIRTVTAEIAFRNAEKSAKSFEEQIEKVKEEMKNLNKSGLTKGLENFGSSLKRIALYRIVRTLIAQIGSAIKTGIGNLVQYSSQANNTMSQLKSSTQQLTNSFGTALMPMLTAITPVIVDLCGVLSNLLNSFAAVSAWIGGDKSYTKAIKNNLDYAASLKKVQNAQLGIDELNVISENEEQNTPTSMFETVELTAGEIAGSIAQITLELGALITMLAIFKGKDIAGIFSKLGTSIKDFLGKMKNMSNVKKGAASIALLAAEAYVCYNAIYDMVTGSKSVGEGLLALIPILAIVGVAMYAMWGPIGLIIGAVVAVISGVVAGIKAVSKAAKDKSMEKFWKTSGVAIKDAANAANTYFKALGLDEQAEWNQSLADTNETLVDAIRNYDVLYSVLSNRDELDSSDIENLSAAFNELADAAAAVNKAAIGSLMSSIRTGIEMNITPELTQKLDGLITSLETAQDLINVKVAGIKGEYQNLLNEIANSGGKITEEQRNMLNQLRSEIATFTLTDNTASEHWRESLREITNAGITAGTSREEVESNVNDLNSERSSYLETLKTNYASSVGTLRQLVELDRTQFGGSLGLYEEGKTFEENSNYKALLESYNAQISEVNKQFDSVLDGIIKAFQDTMAENPQKWYADAFAWLYDWEYYGKKEAYKEQSSLLDWIKSQKGYATGGFPEDDSLIYVNPYEIVGKMSNGKNVVANNEQIVEGIKQGVYEAVTAANQAGNNDGGTDFEVKVYLDGKQITAMVEKNQRKKGVGGSIYKGGVLNGI